MCTIPEISITLPQTKNICRCCLTNNCYKDISLEYYYSGQREVYEDMLRDTFDIQITKYNDTHSLYICEMCISRLRDAHNFKQMVVEAEVQFKKLLEPFGSEDLQLLSESDLNLDILKEEEPDDFGTHNDNIEADQSDEDEVLANIKVVIDKKEKNEQFKKRVKKRLKVQDTGKHKKELETQKDWSKIVEQRGKGPLLRDNSLKLISSSTIYPFQWSKSQYRCFCCKQPFLDINLLKKHMDDSHTIKNVEKEIIQQQNCLVKVEISNINCKICGNQITDINSLRHHLIKHNVKFEIQEDLLIPFKINSETLHCQICQQSFSNFRLLNIHVNTHFQNQVCHICGAGFTNLKFLNLHKTRLHRPLKCIECDLKFKNKKDKRDHDVNIHNLKKEKKCRFPCPFCTERFPQENARIKHLVENHGMKHPQHKCLMCDKVFITKSYRNNHMKCVHLKEKKHECNTCHNLFYTNSDLVRHKVTHTGEKRFSCASCNNVFASKDTLRRHSKRTHAAV